MDGAAGEGMYMFCEAFPATTCQLKIGLLAVTPTARGGGREHDQRVGGEMQVLTLLVTLGAMERFPTGRGGKSPRVTN